MRTDDGSLPESMQRTADGLFFIVGSGRSGTTLLRAMFDANSRLVIPSETQMYGLFNLQYQRMFEEGPNRDDALRRFLAIPRIAALEVSEDRIREMLGGQYDWDWLFLALLTAVREARDKDRIGEKTPKHIMVYDKLATLYPKSKFIHIVRDPRAVVASYVNARFYQYTDGRNPYRAILRWRRVIDKHFEAQQMLGADRYTVVRYEDLAAQPAQQLQRLCSFLDLDFEPEMLDFQGRALPGHVPDKTNRDGIRREVHTESVHKWRKHMRSEQIALIDSMCWDNMLRLGYHPDSEQPIESARNTELRLRIESNLRQRARRVGQALRLTRGGMKDDAR